MKSWRKAKLIPESDLENVEVMIGDLEERAIRLSKVKEEQSGQSSVVSGMESETNSDVRNNCIYSFHI